MQDGLRSPTTHITLPVQNPANLQRNVTLPCSQMLPPPVSRTIALALHVSPFSRQCLKVFGFAHRILKCFAKTRQPRSGESAHGRVKRMSQPHPTHHPPRHPVLARDPTAPQTPRLVSPSFIFFRQWVSQLSAQHAWRASFRPIKCPWIRFPYFWSLCMGLAHLE